MYPGCLRVVSGHRAALCGSYLGWKDEEINSKQIRSEFSQDNIEQTRHIGYSALALTLNPVLTLPLSIIHCQLSTQ